MIQVKKFTFNPFQENTYLLFDQHGNTIVVDPGCMDHFEQQILSNFIEDNGLVPIKLFNTHAHIDHILGNKYVIDKYNIELYLYSSSFDMFQLAKDSAKLYGIPYDESPKAKYFFKEKDIFKLGDEDLEVIFVPGHAPDHVVFFNRKQGWLIGGDTLFKRSIGRTDLPGGNHQQLIDNIKEKLLILPDSTFVYSGHGDETSIGEERKLNPFLV